MLIMKLCTLILFVSLATASAKTSYSQNAKFTLDLERVTVKDLFDKIEKSSEFIFVYYDNIIDLNKVVTVKAENETVEEILDEVFKSSENTFKVFDRQIVIAKKESSNADLESLLVQQPQKKQPQTSEYKKEPIFSGWKLAIDMQIRRQLPLPRKRFECLFLSFRIIVDSAPVCCRQRLGDV